MARQRNLNVREELQNLCSGIYSNDKRVKTHECLKQKWALRKKSANAFDGPMLQLVLKTKTKQRTIFGPIVAVRVTKAQTKKPTKTQKIYYKFIVLAEQSFAIVLVLEESFSLAVVTNYPLDPVNEDLKSKGTVKSGKKVILDGRWLTARLNLLEVVLLGKVQERCRELYKEQQTVRPFKISLRGKGSSQQSGYSAKKLKGKEIAKEAERPVPVAREAEQSPPQSEPAISPSQRGEGLSPARSEPSFLPTWWPDPWSPAQSVEHQSAATSLIGQETVRVRL
jgi:hypothetical protein